jgi:hypothetical protein
MESHGEMRARLILDRLVALPLRHKIIAVAMEVAFIAGGIIWARHLPPQEYVSSVLLFFDRTAVSRLDPAGMHTNRAQAVELAQSILSDDVAKSLCRKLGLFPDEASSTEVAQFRSHLMLSRESTSALRVTWRGGDPSQTVAVANAVAILLTSWVPARGAREPADPVPPMRELPAASIDSSVPHESNAHGPGARRGMKSSKARLQIVLHDEEELRIRLASENQRLAELGKEAHRLEASIAQEDAKRQTALVARQPLMARLTAEKKNLEALRVRYTDAYPDVEAAEERISDIETSLAAMPSGPSSDGDQSHLKSVTKEMDNLNAEKTRLSSQLSEKAKEETNLRGREVEASKLAMRLEQSPVAPQSGPGRSILRGQVAATAPVVANSQIADPTEGDEARVFKVLVSATGAQPTDNPRQILKWLVAEVGPLCGILYLLFAIWRFRAVRNVETLRRIVPGNIAYLGAIPGMSRWRHNE